MNQQRQATPLTQFGDEVEDHRLGGDIEPGGRFVHDQQVGLAGQRHGNDDALLLAARELVRIAACHLHRFGQVHLAQQGLHPRLHGATGEAAPADRLGHLRPPPAAAG